MERAIYEAWVDVEGVVRDRDVDALLRRNAQLRKVIGDVVALSPSVLEAYLDIAGDHRRPPRQCCYESGRSQDDRD
ncbi:hypothetical protein CKO28_14220 [Rhodovibrio sodomensis]|uniref:Uncharacterized protein n=1 Tax=Rhodovibrio sodomensis TaxID=1088 RepID=A0ABS1DFE3_9PROT|nr:hypothetical protein [Rhodovibrio sodomensis]